MVIVTVREPGDVAVTIPKSSSDALRESGGRVVVTAGKETTVGPDPPAEMVRAPGPAPESRMPHWDAA